MTDASKPRRKGRGPTRATNEPEPERSPPVASAMRCEAAAAKPIDADNLDEAFAKALEADFRKYGPTAIEAMRAEKPTDYVKLVAAVRAKDANDTSHPLREMSDAELVRWIDELAARIGCEIRAVGAGAGPRRVGPAPDQGADAD